MNSSAEAPSARRRGLSETQRWIVRGLKVVVCGYWAWVLWANFDSERSAFEAVLVLSAPLLLSLHFVQGLMFIRLLGGKLPWWADFLQILVFGVLHLVPRSLELRSRARSKR